MYHLVNISFLSFLENSIEFLQFQMCLCEEEKKKRKKMAAAKELVTDDVKNNQDPKFWKVGVVKRSIKAPFCS